MRLKVQITVESGQGESEMVEVACLERESLQPDTLGLSLTEARAILAGLEQTLVERQAAEFIVQTQRCARCGRDRACKGHHRIVFRTPFGKLKLDSPQWYRCPCEAPGAKSVSPLAERLPERTSPELTYLETKFAALVSYGLTIKLLREILPIGQHLSTRTIRRQVRHTAERLESHLGEDERDAFRADGCQGDPAGSESPASRVVASTGATSTRRANALEPKGGLR